MASRSIGSIYASLYLRDKDFSKGLKKARADASSFNSTIASLGKKGLVAAGLSSPFVAMGAAIKSAIDQGGALQDMMTRTGAAGEGLVVMQRAFENAGLAADSVPDALNKMQKALAGVNEDGDQTAGVFAKLGLSAEALTAMDPAKAFEAIARAISGIKDPATRTARAMEVFGKSGGKALAVLNDPDAFTLAITQVGGLGKTLADNAGSLDKVGDSMSALQTKVSQLAVGFTVELLPALESLAKSSDGVDFSTVGKGLGNLIVQLYDYAEILGTIASYSPAGFVIGAAIEKLFGGPADMEQAKKDAAQMADPNYKRQGDNPNIPNPAAPALPTSPPLLDQKTLSKEVDDAIKMLGLREEYFKLYKEESDLLNAKLSGDDKAVKALERQRDIREELNRMAEAGYNIQDEANKNAAAAIVDARIKAGEDPSTAPSRAVNSYQSRGLSLDGAPMKKTTDAMMPLLASIKDTLKAAQNGGFTLSW
jgi:hypothetical protein